MRTSSLVGLVVLAISLACSSRAPETTSAALSCPNGVVATVSNPQPFNYDVYYQDAKRPASVIGEIRSGATITFPLPGDGKGRVYVRRPTGDLGNPQPTNLSRPLQDVRIRMHCAGT